MADIKDLNEIIKSSSIIVNQTYSFINNTGFYAMANPVYYNYYYRFARRYGWWYDRYVPDFHNAEQGYFSTGLAHSLVDGIANQIIGKKLLLQNAGYETDKSLSNESLKKAYKWAEEACLTSKLRELTKYAGAIGTALLKANLKGGDVWLEPLRFDDFFFETDFTGDLVDVTCLIKSYTDTKPKGVQWQEKQGNELAQALANKYYLVERRYFKELTEDVNGEMVKHRVPYVVYQVHKYNGNITNAQSWNMSLQETIDPQSLPRDVKKSIGRDFSVLRLGVEQRLPFREHLGCVLVPYNDGDASLSQQPFGQSILADILSDLMDFDLSFSYMVRDMYQGKGTVFAGKELQTKTSGMNAFTGLDEAMITWLNNWNDGSKLPLEKVQFEMRTSEWRDKCSAILERIATKLNISPSSIASYLSDNTARTAKEVTTESSATDNYIDIQRGCIGARVNKLLKVIGEYYGWADDVELRFAKGGSQNIDTIIDRVIKLVNAGLMHPFTALKSIMFDADEWEVEEEYKKIQEYQAERQKQQQMQNETLFGNMDFGTQVTNDEEV